MDKLSKSKIFDLSSQIIQKDNELILNSECIIQLRNELKLLKEHYQSHYESEKYYIIK